MFWTIRLLPIAVLLATAGFSCSPEAFRYDPKPFRYGQVWLGTSDAEADHPARIDPARLEALLGGLDMASEEFAERKAPLFDDPERLRATAEALSRELAGTLPDERVSLRLAWTVGDPGSIYFENELQATFFVREGELHMDVVRFEQQKGGASDPEARHPLRVVPGETSRARFDESAPRGWQSIVIPLDESPSINPDRARRSAGGPAARREPEVVALLRLGRSNEADGPPPPARRREGFWMGSK
ncbi:MAG: hypothetical protein HY720_02205 [Planctomycetes bacterium]|nr:hypothetical protein [Planctomycetota bacterium]